MSDISESRFNDLKDYVEKVQGELSNVQKDVAELKIEVCIISKQVSNHIPHQLEAVTTVLQKLESRIIPFETSLLKYKGVSDFLNHITKFTITLAGLTWTVMQLYSAFTKH
jgi:DNA repair ATPase RecN